jgi:NADH:ubiquinone oxidoreductase subunit 6 (subunit J)
VLFFAWIGLYLLIRIYSGVHKHEREVLEASKRLEDLTQTTYTKYYVFLTTITIILSIVALAGGYLLGREIGLWVGVAISILIWIISPFARETINKK